MALFALSHLMPDGAAHRAAVCAELSARHHALLAPLGIDPPGGTDAQYYALIDLERVVTARHGADATAALTRNVDPGDVPMLLARDHGVVVMPGAGFGGVGWDVRICLAALSVDELTAVGTAIAAVVDQLVPDTH
jgi:aspartate 4-decarboxylase